MYKYYNPNPLSLQTEDCVIRAISILLDQPWDKTYSDISIQGFVMGLMMTSNAVHKVYLEQHGYKMYALPSTCPNCITVAEFAETFPKGKYLLATGDHLVCLIDGTYYDIFDSGQEIVSYYFKKTQKKEKGE